MIVTTGNDTVGVVRVVIHRADGTVEDRGVVSETPVPWWNVKARAALRALRDRKD